MKFTKWEIGYMVSVICTFAVGIFNMIYFDLHKTEWITERTGRYPFAVLLICIIFTCFFTSKLTWEKVKKED